MKLNITKCTKCSQNISVNQLPLKWIDLAEVPFLPDGWQCGAMQQRPNINTSLGGAFNVTKLAANRRQHGAFSRKCSQHPSTAAPHTLSKEKRQAAAQSHNTDMSLAVLRSTFRSVPARSTQMLVWKLDAVQQNTGHAKISANGCWRAQRTACALKELKGQRFVFQSLILNLVKRND